MPAFILPLIVFIIALSVLVLIHEMGHFLVAKYFGIKIEEFGLGYPPRAWGKKIGETIYSLNWLPFGGFVRIYGEDYLETGKSGTRALVNKPKYIRFLVAFAGVVGNFILGVICFSVVYSFMGIPGKVDYVRIDAVAPDSPAAGAGMQAGEIIAQVAGKDAKTTQDFISIVNVGKGNPVQITTRSGKVYTLTPRTNPPAGQGALGVSVSSIDFVFYPVWQMPFRGAWYGIQEAAGWGVMIVSGLATTVVQLVSGITPEVAGPVGIFQITTTVVKQGWMLTLQFVGVLSINLAILNLLPLPALDGGRIAFIAIEALIGRRIKPQIEQYVHMAGMALLISLMLLVTINDFSRFAFMGNAISAISGFVRSITAPQ